MTQAKKTETEKKIGNWTCQLIGSVLLGAQAYKYITDSWNDIAVEITVSCLGVVLIFTPWAIGQYAKRKMNKAS